MKRDIDEILADFLNKEPLNEEEDSSLEQWKSDSSQNEKLVKVIRRLENQKKILDKHREWTEVFEQVEQQVVRRKRKRQLLWVSSCAASVILCVGIFFMLNYSGSPRKKITPLKTATVTHAHRSVPELILPGGERHLLETGEEQVILSDSVREVRTNERTLIIETSRAKEVKQEFYTLNIPFGTEYSVQLADGTKIYLNAGTSLRYPDCFIGETREVFLNGEAYFEVASDSLHPFIVHAENVAVRVLGTSFNVKAYSDEEWVKTTLVQGRVETCFETESFVMKPGTQVAYNKTTQKAKYYPVNTEQYISWKDGYYDFEDMPLGELMKIFSRWYDVEIEFARSEIKEMKFSGRLKRYDDLNSLFNKLEYTQDLKFIVGKDKIIIQSK